MQTISETLQSIRIILRNKLDNDKENRYILNCAANRYGLRYIGRSTRSATVNAHFAYEIKHKTLSTRSLQKEDVIFLPTKLGKRTANIYIEKIPEGMDVLRIVPVVMHDREKEVGILQMKK